MFSESGTRLYDFKIFYILVNLASEKVSSLIKSEVILIKTFHLGTACRFADFSSIPVNSCISIDAGPWICAEES